MVDLLQSLAALESPSQVAAAQQPVFDVLADQLRPLGFAVRRWHGHETGGVLLARPVQRVRGRPAQLLLGHCDTVWPLGTLERMPVLREGNILRGPGVFDMKGGLVLMVAALQALHALQLQPALTPVLLVNSDEEIGSPEFDSLDQAAGAGGRAGVDSGARVRADRQAEDRAQGSDAV